MIEADPTTEPLTRWMRCSVAENTPVMRRRTHWVVGEVLDRRCRLAGRRAVDPNVCQYLRSRPRDHRVGRAYRATPCRAAISPELIALEIDEVR